MSDLKFMHGTTGVYQTEYAGSLVTVRVFEAVELAGRSVARSGWLAVTTFINLSSGELRIDTDHLEPPKVEHCKTYAAKADPSYGELFKAHMAHAYWRTIV